MARLVVYGRSSFCPDMYRWRRWLEVNPVPHVELDIEADDVARERLLSLIGCLAVPTLVIAPDDGLDPIEEPAPSNRVRAVDRGTLISEPNPAQIVPFLARHGVVGG